MFDGLDPVAQVILVNPGQLASWAAHVRPHLEKMAANSGGRYWFIDILTAIAAGKMQLWLVVLGPDLIAVMVSEVVTYPRARSLRMVGLVGTRPRTLRKLVASVEETARREFGCNRMEAFHIPRFRAILPGYETTHWFSEKSL